MVKSRFSQIEPRVLHRGSFRDVYDLKKTILAFVHPTNVRAEPWTWVKDASRMPEKGAKIPHLKIITE